MPGRFPVFVLKSQWSVWREGDGSRGTGGRTHQYHGAVAKEGRDVAASRVEGHQGGALALRGGCWLMPGLRAPATGQSPGAAPAGPCVPSTASGTRGRAAPGHLGHRGTEREPGVARAAFARFLGQRMAPPDITSTETRGCGAGLPAHPVLLERSAMPGVCTHAQQGASRARNGGPAANRSALASAACDIGFQRVRASRRS